MSDRVERLLTGLVRLSIAGLLAYVAACGGMSVSAGGSILHC